MSRLAVRVIPNASKSEVIGREGATWKIRLAAPPIEGKANEALIRFLADVLNLAPSEIDIARGHSSRTKTLDIPLSAADVDEAISKASLL